MNLRSASVAGLTILMLATPAAFPQGLADTAKKEQARRKKAAPAGTAKVYTESDLPAPLPGAPAETGGDKAANRPVVPKSPAGATTSDDRQREQIAAYREHEARLKEQVERTEAMVQRLAAHPTGGGKVCRLPEGVFEPGVTAPEHVVCPYQMESRYDRAKRELEAAKAELAKLQEMGQPAGIRR